MSLKIHRLRTHWQAADAELIIDFLDELRDLLCETYGEDIAEMHRAEARASPAVLDELGATDFDDEIEF